MDGWMDGYRWWWWFVFFVGCCCAWCWWGLGLGGCDVTVCVPDQGMDAEIPCRLCHIIIIIRQPSFHIQMMTPHQLFIQFQYHILTDINHQSLRKRAQAALCPVMAFAADELYSTQETEAEFDIQLSLM